MDKADVKHETQSDTSSVINMKEYAPSEYPSSEPPPAYMKSRPNSLRIARLAAFTLLASAIILGSFILAASWIQANTARNLDLTLNQELMDELHPTYEHLVGNDLLQEQQDNALTQEGSPEKKQAPQPAESLDNQREQEEQDTRQQMTSQEGGSSLELDAIANVLMQKGMRGNVNCIVEKRRNEELVDHAPRALNIPGLNITTPPRLQHLTGEQVVIICKDDSSEEKDDDKDDEQTMMLPIPPQFLQQAQQVPQGIPLAQILQQIQAQQAAHALQQQMQQQQLQQQQQQQQQQIPIFVPHQQPQQEQQVFYHPQQAYQQPQVYQQPQQMYQPQPQVQHIFYPQQQQQSQQRQVFIPQQMVYRQPQEEQQVPEQQPPMPLHPVPLSQLMSRRPVNPMAVQDVPVNQMPLTHMPMRDARMPERMPEQPIPVHHLVPPRPQQVQVENFSQDEGEFRRELPAFIRERLMEREREMMGEREREDPRPLPLEAREPRIMRGPVFPISDNRLQEEPQQPMSPRFPPARRFRFPDSSEPQGMAITRIIPIRLEKIQDSNEENTSGEEKRPLPIPLNAILDMVFRGIRPLVNRQPFPVPIDIKIERIIKPIPENVPESEESQEQEDSQEDGQESQEETENTDEKADDATEAKVEQVEIVEKEGDNTQAIPIPADAQDAQIFKLDDKPEGEWMGRAFLPNGLGRGGVFPIPQGIREAQIFTVSDARAGVPVSASFEATANKEEERQVSKEAAPQPEGEVNLFPVPMNAERSVKLFPVEESNEKPQQDQKVDSPQQLEMAESIAHVVQPRSV